MIPKYELGETVYFGANKVMVTNISMSMYYSEPHYKVRGEQIPNTNTWDSWGCKESELRPAEVIWKNRAR